MNQLQRELGCQQHYILQNQALQAQQSQYILQIEGLKQALSQALQMSAQAGRQLIIPKPPTEATPDIALVTGTDLSCNAVSPH